MKKPIFNMIRRGLDPLPVKFEPLIIIAGSEAHTLALHRDPHHKNPRKSRWQVSDPKSGACVVREVPGDYKGMPVRGDFMTLREARIAAMFAVDQLIERIGSARFNAVLADPKPF